jgi:hypothetical protein
MSEARVDEHSDIHHYECQNCGEELDWVEIDECPACGSDELEEIHVITDGSGAEVTDGDGQCPLCDEVGEEQRSGVGPTGNIGTLYECTNEDCKAGTYLHGRRP